MSKQINTYIIHGHANWDYNNKFHIVINSNKTNIARKNAVEQMMKHENVYAVCVDNIEKTR
jgi:hypothetical protein